MCALRLECFTNDALESSKTISLFEGFESEKDIAFSKGVRSGAEAASKAFEAEKIRSLAPILEALNDIGFSQVEARHAAINSLKPLIFAILQTSLPASAAAGFGTEVADRVMSIIEKLPEAKINVYVPEGAVASIQKMLSPAKANIQVHSDPDLGLLSARVDWGSGFEQLDIDAVIQSIQTAIHTFFTPIEALKSGGNHA